MTTAQTFEQALDALRARNAQWALFVEAYLSNGLNATRAAISAGYAESSARVQGHRLITNDNIRAVLNLGLEAAAMGPDEVIARLSRFAAGSLEPFLDVDEDTGLVCFDLSSEAAKGALGTLKKIKSKSRVMQSQSDNEYIVVDQSIELEINDPAAALDKLARWHGLYKDRVALVDETSEELQDERRTHIRQLEGILARARARRGGEEE